MATVAFRRIVSRLSDGFEGDLLFLLLFREMQARTSSHEGPNKPSLSLFIVLSETEDYTVIIFSLLLKSVMKELRFIIAFSIIQQKKKNKPFR